VFGVDESETYDYQFVNKAFPIDFKVYIKKLACYPQLITEEIYNKASFLNLAKVKGQEVKQGKQSEMLPLNVKDKLFLNIVAIEAKR